MKLSRWSGRAKPNEVQKLCHASYVVHTSCLCRSIKRCTSNYVGTRTYCVPSSAPGISADLLNSVPADVASLGCLPEFLCSRISYVTYCIVQWPLQQWKGPMRTFNIRSTVFCSSHWLVLVSCDHVPKGRILHIQYVLSTKDSKIQNTRKYPHLCKGILNIESSITAAKYK